MSGTWRFVRSGGDNQGPPCRRDDALPPGWLFLRPECTVMRSHFGGKGSLLSVRDFARKERPRSGAVWLTRDAPVFYGACMADDFSERYGSLLAGSYDCPDRIVLNAFYSPGYSGGGFRYWWRQL